MTAAGHCNERTNSVICRAIASPNPILRRYFIVCNPFWIGEPKTAHDRIMRYEGGRNRQASQHADPLVGIPHDSQNGFWMRGTRA
jgi:hypothetical protein